MSEVRSSVKYAVMIVCILMLTFSKSFAVEISDYYGGNESYGGLTQNIDASSCYSYIKSDKHSERDVKSYVSCFRREWNKISSSKEQVCGYNDGRYSDFLQFSRTPDASDVKANILIEPISKTLIKLGSKIYYIVQEGIGESNSVKGYYFFSYDCITKKVILHRKYTEGWSTTVPLWIDAKAKKAYLMDGNYNYLGFSNPAVISEVSLTTNKVRSYQLFNDIKSSSDGINTFISSSFDWSFSVERIVLGWIKKKSKDEIVSHYPQNNSNSEIFDVRKSSVRLNNMDKGIGDISFIKPGYVIKAKINFNKKTIY